MIVDSHVFQQLHHNPVVLAVRASTEIAASKSQAVIAFTAISTNTGIIVIVVTMTAAFM
jgi:hypothetical protein